MNILQKMAQKAQDNLSFEGVTIAFLGDSVTQGCFELITKTDGTFVSTYDKRNCYSAVFSDMLATLFPTVPVNIINAGIGGDSAHKGALRVERDVLRHAPDLVVVCYGLNDCGETESTIPRYVGALSSIFEQIQKSGCELIFMTPNMMNTEVSPLMSGQVVIEIAEKTAQKQTSGVFDTHIEAAKMLCQEKNIPVCDCYAIWKAFHAGGVNTTELLSNKINHPTREMTRIFSYELIKTMFGI